jgi:tRNA pseudouridine13 synthase
VRGRYKVEPEDFLVEEIPAYEPRGTGKHLWLFVEKRGIATFDLLERLGEALDFDPRAIGCAGLKDAQSISRQWVSLENVEPSRAAGLSDDTFTVLRTGLHDNKLRMGHLRGNRFVVTLRGTEPGDLDVVQQNLAELARLGVPNYFGEQRFGKRGANLQKGLQILCGNPRAMARRMPKRLFGLLVSAVQSEVFNRVVLQRLPALSTLLPGDVACLHKNGACFRVQDLAAEQARADRFEISPTGPLPGSKTMPTDGEAKALEDAVLAAMELDPALFTGLPFGVAAGDRRPLRLPLAGVAAREVPEGLQLEFTLPKGSYATAVLRELLAETIWFGGA